MRRMTLIYALLLIAALVCFVIAASGRRVETMRVGFLPLGLAFWVAVPLLQLLDGKV